MALIHVEGTPRTMFGAHIILLMDRASRKVVSARVCFESKMSEESAAPYAQALYLSSYNEDAKQAIDTVVNIAANNPEHAWVFQLEEPCSANVCRESGKAQDDADI